MINHIINYKDLEFDITVSQDSTTVKYLDNGVNTMLDLVGNSANKKQKNIICNYVKKLLDGNGNPIPGIQYPQLRVTSPNYDKIYNIVVNGTEGIFADSGLVNLMLQDNTGDPNCIAFDITNGYAPIQPIIYTVGVVDATATVTVNNYDNTKTPLFSLDDTDVWEEGIIFENLTVGDHVIKAKYSGEQYIFNVSFIVEEEVQE